MGGLRAIFTSLILQLRFVILLANFSGPALLYYQTSDQIVYGPFPLHQIIEWKNAGYFDGNLLVTSEPKSNYFIPLYKYCSELKRITEDNFNEDASFRSDHDRQYYFDDTVKVNNRKSYVTFLQDMKSRALNLIQKSSSLANAGLKSFESLRKRENTISDRFEKISKFDDNEKKTTNIPDPGLIRSDGIDSDSEELHSEVISNTTDNINNYTYKNNEYNETVVNDEFDGIEDSKPDNQKEISSKFENQNKKVTFSFGKENYYDDWRADESNPYDSPRNVWTLKSIISKFMSGPQIIILVGMNLLKSLCIITIPYSIRNLLVKTFTLLSLFPFQIMRLTLLIGIRYLLGLTFLISTLWGIITFSNPIPYAHNFLNVHTDGVSESIDCILNTININIKMKGFIKSFIKIISKHCVNPLQLFSSQPYTTLLLLILTWTGYIYMSNFIIPNQIQQFSSLPPVRIQSSLPKIDLSNEPLIEYSDNSNTPNFDLYNSYQFYPLESFIQSWWKSYKLVYAFTLSLAMSYYFLPSLVHLLSHQLFGDSASSIVESISKFSSFTSRIYMTISAMILIEMYLQNDSPISLDSIAQSNTFLPSPNNSHLKKDESSKWNVFGVLFRPSNKKGATTPNDTVWTEKGKDESTRLSKNINMSQQRKQLELDVLQSLDLIKSIHYLVQPNEMGGVQRELTNRKIIDYLLFLMSKKDNQLSELLQTWSTLQKPLKSTKIEKQIEEFMTSQQLRTQNLRRKSQKTLRFTVFSTALVVMILVNLSHALSLMKENVGEYLIHFDILKILFNKWMTMITHLSIAVTYCLHQLPHFHLIPWNQPFLNDIGSFLIKQWLTIQPLIPIPYKNATFFMLVIIVIPFQLWINSW